MSRDNTKLAERIKALRTERGLSQADVAKGIKLAQPSYHYLENGPTRAKLSHLIKLAAFYELPLSEAFPDYELSAEERLIVEHAQGRPFGGQARLRDLTAA